MRASARAFTVEFTQPLGNGVSVELLKSATSMESWTYRDAPDYGSPELDLHVEESPAIRISSDRRSIEVGVASAVNSAVHPRQTARVYHVKIAAQTLFDGAAPRELNAYYTLRQFPPVVVSSTR
jgi:hypothetical protein